MDKYNMPDLELRHKIANWIERIVRYLKHIAPFFIVVMMIAYPVFA